MRHARYRSQGPPSFFPFLSVLLCVLGVLMFLAAGLASGSLRTAISNIRIEIEGSSEHERAPIFLECTKNGARSFDDKYKFSATQEEAMIKGAKAVEDLKWAGTPYTDFLAALSRSRDKEYIVFIVRPDGIEIFKSLRLLAVLRNKVLCTTSAEWKTKDESQVIQALPAELRAKVQVEGGRLSLLGRMSSADRQRLHDALGPAAAPMIDSVFEKSQHAQACIEHGVELVPAEWQFQKDASGLGRFLKGRERIP